MASKAENLLGLGRAALEEGDWATARALLSDALAEEETPDTLHLLARAVEWAADYAAAVGYYERAYLGFRSTGRNRLAALIAGRELSFLHAAVYGNMAVANGWLARARSLARDVGDCVERGWVDLAEALMVDDPESKDRHIRSAAEIARRFGDSDLAFCALGYQGTSLVLRGHIAEGMRCVDESAAAATSGEVKDYLAVGEIYCKMLLCCELTLDVRRAQQWVAVAETFGRQSHAPWVSAICRTHYGGILTAAGRWREAEHELADSVALYDSGFRAMRSGALVRLAELRVRQGRFDEAERLLEGCEDDSFAIRPLARMHLGRGEAALAATLLRRFLAAAGSHPLLAPEWALLAEAEVAAGRIEAAVEVCARLETIADGPGPPHLRGFARYAAGLTAAAAERPAALAHFESALSAFTEAGLPLEAGRARLATAQLLADSQPAVAIAEARSALATFEGLAAVPDADQAAGLLRRLGRPGRPAPRVSGPLTRREQEVLGHIGAGLSNQQIAHRLVISKRTVEHHVGNILAKLGLASRAEAVAYALRHGSDVGVTRR